MRIRLLTMIPLGVLLNSYAFADGKIIASDNTIIAAPNASEIAAWEYTGSDPTQNITNKATLSANGLTIKEGPSVLKDGIHAGDKKITNVADGEISATSHEAINGSQLHSELAKLGNSRGGGY